ncbi:hypothetical protein DTL42_03255 [Bremerella cremea]|uniref:Uncharacterized protein n=1 Tax=Bremerella cremea TaxID=1031537 RepID=A0A368KV30_9BACT|nr:hypothetical protein [Bremerella cremea]RCS54181.1 hypothetical protein DTL42_03255 [Bremerella cremea]
MTVLWSARCLPEFWAFYMTTVLRTIAAIVVSMVVVFVLVIAVEGFSAVVHPFPEGMDMHNQEEMCEHVASYPAWVLAAVVPMWGAIALVGTGLAQWIGNWIASSIIGTLLLIAVAFNVSMLPYPFWFKVVILLIVPAASLLGAWAGHPKAKRPVTNES